MKIIRSIPSVITAIALGFAFLSSLAADMPAGSVYKVEDTTVTNMVDELTTTTTRVTEANASSGLAMNNIEIPDNR